MLPHFGFVHLTDPHLFGGGASEKENFRAFRWAVDEINQRVARGTEYSFIVVTGDLGLEKLPSQGTNPVVKIIAPAAKKMGHELKRSHVKTWFFVPGNNDLWQENPETIFIYDSFIKALQFEVQEFTIADLTPRPNLPASGKSEYKIGTHTWRIVGFNNASFKSNDQAKDARAFVTNQLASIELVRAAVRSPPEVDHTLIFYHIPEIDDPYYASLPSGSFNLLKRHESRAELGVDYPLSAWTVADEVRQNWNTVVTNTTVRACSRVTFIVQHVPSIRL